ncbi:uncharacterized protein SETTUDRAFT_29046 [Exserohilum turcica Et28A]|uniref:Uncharacterized protein n=1 Tax=Exserohilum turcicum (strain 28A) TaxID=671987 RepID=R0KBW7_EXST2|nr:uncharacterized protein SETTUDRAFT_29046 [Exserohilum turcica Et28A]EOA85712.1 hypothetical protein SETTUDRAFT_29046 [Exserohilum turcica Et28A]
MHNYLEQIRTTTQTALKKSRPTIYDPIQINDHSTVVMGEGGGFPLMNLRTELRCDVFSYLPDITYEPVFFKSSICSWEVKNQLLPKIVLGPTRTEIDSIYITLSDTFHEAGKEFQEFLGKFQEHGDKVENISLELAFWYDNTNLPQRVPSGDEEVFNIQTKYRPERLYRFVKQTL